jgi:hypothetical protein
MNYWFWLLIILIPAIVFSVKPQANLWLRTGRLVLAVGLGYMLLNLSLHLKLDNQWDAYNSCRYEYSGHGGPYETSLASEMDKICPRKLHSGAQLTLYFIMGWIPAVSYTGLWELIWRLHHRTTLGSLQNSFNGRWLSNILIAFSLVAAYPAWLFFTGLIY